MLARALSVLRGLFRVITVAFMVVVIVGALTWASLGIEASD